MKERSHFTSEEAVGSSTDMAAPGASHEKSLRAFSMIMDVVGCRYYQGTVEGKEVRAFATAAARCACRALVCISHHPSPALQKLRLVRDPRNHYDSNCIRVLNSCAAVKHAPRYPAPANAPAALPPGPSAGGDQVGNLPATLAADLAPLVDHGLVELRAKVAFWFKRYKCDGARMAGVVSIWRVRCTTHSRRTAAKDSTRTNPAAPGPAGATCLRCLQSMHAPPTTTSCVQRYTCMGRRVAAASMFHPLTTTMRLSDRTGRARMGASTVDGHG